MKSSMARYVVALIVFVIAWNLIAPTQLGGRVSYVNVRGISMEPTLVTGDLLVMRQRDTYNVGQVVAFRSDMGGAVVVHRIVATDGDRYLLKGDNNTFLDRYTPTTEEILGAEVLMVPGGERLTTIAASTPAIVLQTALFALATFAIYSSRQEAKRQRRDARRRRTVNGPFTPSRQNTPQHVELESAQS
jgi:signal peptidase I